MVYASKTEGYIFIEIEISNSTISTAFCQPLNQKVSRPCFDTFCDVLFAPAPLSPKPLLFSLGPGRRRRAPARQSLFCSPRPLCPASARGAIEDAKRISLGEFWAQRAAPLKE